MTTKPILVCDRVRVKQDVPCAYSGKAGQVVGRSVQPHSLMVLFDDDIVGMDSNRPAIVYAKTVPLKVLEIEA